MKINGKVVAELKLAKERLEALVAVGDSSRCALDDDVKEEVRSYVQTWITPLLVSALDRIEGRKETRGGGK